MNEQEPTSYSEEPSYSSVVVDWPDWNSSSSKKINTTIIKPTTSFKELYNILNKLQEFIKCLFFNEEQLKLKQKILFGIRLGSRWMATFINLKNIKTLQQVEQLYKTDCSKIFPVKFKEE